MDTTIINISISKKLLKEADAIAKKESRNRSELFREAVRSYLIKRDRLVGLYSYGANQAEKLGVKESDVAGLIQGDRCENSNCS